VKTLAAVTLLLVTCTISAAQCSVDCQKQIDALTAKVDTLQKQIANLPAGEQFDLTPTIQNNQYQTLRPLNSKAVLVNVSVDQQNATLLSVPGTVPLGPGQTAPAQTVLTRVCPGRSTRATISLWPNSLYVLESPVDCGVFPVHVFLLLRP
jgi:hypothetical protein